MLTMLNEFFEKLMSSPKIKELEATHVKGVYYTSAGKQESIDKYVSVLQSMVAWILCTCNWQLVGTINGFSLLHLKSKVFSLLAYHFGINMKAKEAYN